LLTIAPICHDKAAIGAATHITGTGFTDKSWFYNSTTDIVYYDNNTFVGKLERYDPFNGTITSDTRIDILLPPFNGSDIEPGAKIALEWISFDGGDTTQRTNETGLFVVVDDCTPPPVVWYLWSLLAIGLLLLTFSSTVVHMCSKMPKQMPLMHNVQPPTPAVKAPEKKKQHWNVAASNYIGAAGPVAVKWGVLGEVVEGERAIDNNVDEACTFTPLELEIPDPEVVKPGFQCNRWWMLIAVAACLILGAIVGLADVYD
jgi:hypothetical protein